MHHNQVTKMISRRHILAAVGGATLSLPWLESLAEESTTTDGRDSAPPKRLAFFYLPNGITRRGFFPG